ncbi:putative tocopherol C-methyltransferase [Helianthus annuus]|nr:putative tocopherol C-methyltransferase [Helianthus annuus]
MVVYDQEKKPKSIVDVSYDIGGSSRYLARMYGAECHRVTLSPMQAKRV